MIPEILLFFIGLFPVIGTLKSSYKFVRIFPLFYRTFSFFSSDFFDAKKSKNVLFPFIDPFLLLLSSLRNVSTFIFLLIIDNLCERRNYSDFYYHAQLWNDVSNHIRKFQHFCSKAEEIWKNNSASSWVRTRALVVRRLERRPLTCEAIPTALRLLVTWPTAWDAPFSYEFYFEKPYCYWWNRFQTVKKQICFSKCRFYIAIYRWSLVIEEGAARTALAPGSARPSPTEDWRRLKSGKIFKISQILNWLIPIYRKFYCAFFYI